ncbi:snapalysin family zinc-dependent metalloprotease [Catenulispora sp. NF23]|uniref:snapalysin family zinc-dependent metalloprotease n=1 Tax=Catenulispora pinistramenti TaxID=2705254 RepID=UPI001BA7E15F|nr:snapalysin family zinc-dependent metalloprotease [Catenulispora pinistramenti]MBS2533340.1 snapalysin family zinc-dependent metalloprotease [Catenulispora pinistramenti]
MRTKLTARVFALGVCVLLPLATASVSQAASFQAASFPTAVTPHDSVRVVYYEDTDAGDWQSDVATATAVWNSSVDDVKFVEADSEHQATVHLIATSGWPETSSDDPGSGTVELGEEAVSEGYSAPRITAHELGHILGLPDNYNGDCAALMSGHSAGTDCTNDHPDASEIANVEAIFADGFRLRMPAHVYRDDAATPSMLVHG